MHAHRIAKKIGCKARHVADPVVKIFMGFCGEHHGFMDADRFELFCRRCFIIDGKFTGADARGAFATVLPFGQERICLDEFSDALEVIAKRKGQRVETLRSSVALCAGSPKKASAVAHEGPADPPDKDAIYTIGGHRLPMLRSRRNV